MMPFVIYDIWVGSISVGEGKKVKRRSWDDEDQLRCSDPLTNSFYLSKVSTYYRHVNKYIKMGTIK